jgi:MFS family permease
LVVQLFIVRAFELGARRIFAIGLTICLAAIISCLFLANFIGLVAAFGVAGLGYGLAQPGLAAAASNAADRGNQGQIAGQLQAAMSVAWILGPLAGTTAYAAFIRGPLLLAAAALALGVAMLFVVRRQFSLVRP